jgi:hypothetical protein
MGETVSILPGRIRSLVTGHSSLVVLQVMIRRRLNK